MALRNLALLLSGGIRSIHRSRGTVESLAGQAQAAEPALQAGLERNPIGQRAYEAYTSQRDPAPGETALAT